jgi:hypothetical protein
VKAGNLESRVDGREQDGVEKGENLKDWCKNRR